MLAAAWLSLPMVATWVWYKRKAYQLEAATVPHIRAFRTSNASDLDLYFDGSTAKTLKRTRSYYPRNFEAQNFVLTEYLITPNGKYFIVKATPTKGVHYCKPMDQVAVNILFKSREVRGDA
jgi:hypothetical protein